MANIKTYIEGRDISGYVNGLSSLSEYNDEGHFNSGVFRRSNIVLTLNNQSGVFNTEGSLFNGSRENKKLEIFYLPNDKKLDPVFVYEGFLTEDSTSEDIGFKTIEFTFVDVLKFLEGVSIEEGDQERIASTSSGSILNASFIRRFLSFVNSKGNLGLTYEVVASIASIFPPDDSYYELQDVPALDVLSTFVRSTNSWLSIERGKKIVINPRNPTPTLINVLEEDILNVEDLSDGYNKIYNVIRINNRKSYSDSASIRRYDTRILNVDTHAAPSQTLANDYLRYYKDPKKECDLTLKMNARTLNFRIGMGLQVDIRGTKDVKAFSLTSQITGKSVDFRSQIVILRIREL